MESSAKTLPRMHNANPNDFQPDKYRKDEIRERNLFYFFKRKRKKEAKYTLIVSVVWVSKGQHVTCHPKFSFLGRPIFCFIIIIEREGENCRFNLIINPLPNFKKISFRNALSFTVLNSKF